MLFRVLALAVRRVSKPHGRRSTVARGTIVANISPQAPRLGLAVARRQHRHRRVVRVQLASFHHVAMQRFDQRFD
jgi:hypothetical protein